MKERKGKKGKRDEEKAARRVTWPLMRDFASETRRIWRPPLMGLEAGSLALLLGDEITTSRSDAFDGYRLPFPGRLSQCLAACCASLHQAQTTPVGPAAHVSDVSMPWHTCSFL